MGAIHNSVSLPLNLSVPSVFQPIRAFHPCSSKNPNLLPPQKPPASLYVLHTTPSIPAACAKHRPGSETGPSWEQPGHIPIRGEKGKGQVWTLKYLPGELPSKKSILILNLKLASLQAGFGFSFVFFFFTKTQALFI